MTGSFWEFIRTPTYESGVKGVLSEEFEEDHVENRLIANARAGVKLKENLTKAERNALKQVAKELEAEP